jgi:hypothetical protein
MSRLSYPEAERARRVQLEASRQAEAAAVTLRDHLEEREVEQWQLLFASRHSRQSKGAA